MTENVELIAKYGAPLRYDSNFRGPKWRNRSCTDVPFLLIFLLFIGGLGYIAHYGIQRGDINKLIVPTDSFNQKCGLDWDVRDKPHLFFFNLTKCIDPLVPLTGCPTTQVCVAKCPTQTFIWDTMKNSESLESLKSKLICVPDVKVNDITRKEEIEREIMNDRCARWYLKSAPFLNRCMWEFSPELCEYIPSFLLPRQRRDSLNDSHIYYKLDRNPRDSDEIVEAKLQALALTIDQQIASPVYSDSTIYKSGTTRTEEQNAQCRTRTQLGESVIKEKMVHANTHVAKLVGNLIARFYNGTKNPQQLGEEIVEDIFNSWHIVLVVLICTLCAALLYIALMRWLAGPILWLSILGVLAGLVVAVFYTVQQYRRWEAVRAVPNHSVNVYSVVKNIIQDKNTWLYLAIFLSICLLIVLLTVIILRSRIHIAIALIKEGSNAISSVFSTVFFPVFSWILYIAVAGFAITIGLYLGSIGQPIFRMTRSVEEIGLAPVRVENCICRGPAINYTVGERCEPDLFDTHCYNPDLKKKCVKTSCRFAEIENSRLVKIMIAYNIFGFFWLSFFVAAFNEMVLAATFATWYWTLKKRDVPYFTLWRAFRQTAFYHLGTVALGSLILAICRMIRVALEYIDQKLKHYDNSVTRAILCMLKCFFWLLENFLRFLNRNAYIMCAIHGQNFCTSAKDAFNLIMRNFLRVITLDKVTDFLFFISKILLTATAATATYFWLELKPNLVQLNYNLVPTVIVFLMAYLIIGLFFSVYSMAVDTLFLCFLEDCERNDGSIEKPYYMSKILMKILGKRNERPPREIRNRT